MLKHYIKTTEALKNLRADTKGVVSFEYILVAACIVTAVVAAFGIGPQGDIQNKLSAAITTILGKINIT